jgi:hypothetical protein
MFLETSESKNTDPTEVVIDVVLKQLDGADNHFAILATDVMNYMQTSGSPETGFVLEYQAGFLEQHFRAPDSQIPLDNVVEAFKSYLKQDGHWKSAFDWQREELSSRGGCASAIALLALVIGTLSAVMRLVV